jgi:hypothetical protein
MNFEVKSSLRREKEKWARRGGHALPGFWVVASPLQADSEEEERDSKVATPYGFTFSQSSAVKQHGSAAT